MTTVLRESSETAARERLRLEAMAGRPRLTAVLHRVPLLARHLGSEDAARSGLRYQPVAWTGIVLVAVAFWFPGRSDSDRAPAPVSTAVTVASPVTTTTVVAATATPTTLVPPAASFTRPSTPSAPPSGSTSPTTTVPVAPPPSSGGSDEASVPLSVRGFGWASALAGTGLSSSSVPEGTMPVANRLGRLDKASFVRLAGSETTLTLVEDADGAREAIGAAAVVVCPITDPGWAEEPDQSFDDAPTWDETACVAGVEAASDGTWTFDLSGFTDVAGDRGFALVPDAAAPADFQVTFTAG